MEADRYAHQRAAGFLCRVRKYRDEPTARRVLWAIRLNGRFKDNEHDVKYCELCRAWHMVKTK